jgi:hypothetical protein
MKKTTFTESIGQVLTLTNGSFKRFVTLLILPCVLFAMMPTDANAQCNAPTALNATSIGVNSATLQWTTANPPATNHQWVVTVGGAGLATDGDSGCPSSGQAVIVMTVTNSTPGFTRAGNVISYVANGLPPGTNLEFFVSETCVGVGSSTVSDCAGPFAFTTFDSPITTSTSSVRPSCPFSTPAYMANGSFSVVVGNGTCVGTYTVSAVPVAGSGPAGSTPPNTTVTAYIGFGAGTFFFNNAGAGQYTVTVNQTGSCVLATNPTILTVTVLDGLDTTAPNMTVQNIIGDILAEVPATTTLNLGNIQLPEGACGRQDQFFVTLFDNCDQTITASNAVTASAATTPVTINPGTQTSVSTDGIGNYLVDVHWSVGTTVLSISGRDAAGNIALLTITANVIDNINPSVTIIGNTSVNIPACSDDITVIYSVNVGDLCDQFVDFNNLTFTVTGATVAPNFTGATYREYLVTFPSEGTYLLQAEYTDFYSNVGFFDIIVNVNRLTSDAPILILSGNGQFTVPQCSADIPVIFSGTVIDCNITSSSNPATISSYFSLTGAPLTLTYVDTEDGYAYFEFTGNLSAGSYLVFVTYNNGNFSTSVDVLTDVVQQQAPPVNLGCVGNINVTLSNDCSVTITPSMLLNGTFGCLTDADFTIEINGSFNNVLTACGTYTYMVRLAPGVSANFNPCWGTITVEDKRSLFLSCGTAEIECFEALELGFLGDVSQACDGCQDVNNVLIREEIRNANCANPAEALYTTLITRTYRLTDIFGNVNECTDSIWVRRASFNMADYQMPADVELTCTATAAQIHPSNTGYPRYRAGGANISLDPTNASLICNLLIKHDDMELNGGCGGTRKIMRMWTITEWYCGTIVPRIVGSQIITLKDTQGPSINCSPATQTVWTAPNSCSRDLFIPRPVVSDNCSPTSAIRVSLEFGNNPFIPNFQGGIVTGFQPGNNLLVFRAYDECGNSSSCTRVITVVDEIAPIAICQRNTTVSLGSDGTARVPKESFDDGSFDNCGIVDIKVRRMTPGQCGIDNIFRDFVDVCCADVAAPVTVILRVTDTSGNTNECMVDLEVQDKLPAVLIAPPNITVECGFDLDNLSIFGKVANINAGETRNPIVINGVTVGQDGYAYDNCALTIGLTEVRNINTCGVGTITRTFTAMGAGNTVQQVRVQTITVIYDFDRFNNNILFPCDFTTSDLCVNNPATELAPEVLAQFNGSPNPACGRTTPATRIYDRPRTDDDACTQYGISYKDHVFEIQDSACYKILREWKVIDWCMLEAFPGTPLENAIRSHTQVIKIMNTVAPVITCPENITVCSFQEVCSTGETLTRTATATDDCTATADLFWRWQYFQNVGNASTFVTANATPTATGLGASVTRNFPVGTHVIRYVVEDKCGNTAACTSSVTIQDCKKPTPVCHDLTTTLMPAANAGDQMVTIDAVNFNAGSFDNCTAANALIYRIEYPIASDGSTPPPANATSATFTCDDLGLRNVRVWVGDTDGNWDFCTTTILVQNNMGQPCPGGIQGGMIAGRVMTETQSGVESVAINTVGLTMNSNATNVEGMFQLGSVPMGSTFDLVPERNDAIRNGVNTADIIHIQRHILNIERLNTPYKMIAADVNKSGTITGQDLVEIRRVILGTNEAFSGNKSWRFVDENFTFNDPQNPLSENFPEMARIQNYSGNTPAVKFVGIKVGDVTLDARANSAALQGASSRSNRTLTFNVEDKQIISGNEYSVTFKAAEFNQIVGYQFTLGFDASAIALTDVKGEALNINEHNFGLARLDEGFITTSWNDVKGVNMNADADVFTLTFRAVRNANLSQVFNVNSAITNAEAYQDGVDGNMNVALNFVNPRGAISGEFELFQNRPNPFKGETIIGFNLPDAGQATISIFDVTGRLLRTVDGDFNKGYNEVRMNSSELGASGILYYELRTPYATATKKMFLVD